MNTAIRLRPDVPAIILAPMDGLTDAPMRAVQGELGVFSFAVSEFVRVSGNVLPRTVFHREIPELLQGGCTPTGLPVQVQLLGGNPELMAESAVVACRAGAQAIDINFGCPAATVNNHDGGATLLKYPKRIRDIVAAIRQAVPPTIPVSAKLRLGWDSEDAIFENAAMAAEGGADWLTIHGRTRTQGYKPPALWRPIGKVREQLKIPVVANGDIRTREGFRRCFEETGCLHVMVGRGAIADPFLTHRIAAELGIAPMDARPIPDARSVPDWRPYLMRLVMRTPHNPEVPPMRAERYLVSRMKQWLRVAEMCDNFPDFRTAKRATTIAELFASLG
ncbi:MAG: tRNA-dihydrouridine synthase family protein [Capsulimonadales bacterium]|nr:tRNA-dihydrouridine synthase family protein [Capsulimonadales bacterium]